MSLFRLLLAAGLAFAANSNEDAVLVPVQTGLWRVSPSGNAIRTSFEFPQANFQSNTESRLSPSRKYIAFLRGSNIWLLHTKTMECERLTAFPEWDFKASGAQSTVMMGWSRDEKKILMDTVSADWSGEGGPPEGLKDTSLVNCSSQTSRNPISLPKNYGPFVLHIASRTMTHTDAPLDDVHPDGMYGGSISPMSGGPSASPSGSAIEVGAKKFALGGTVKRYWWLPLNRLAVVSDNEAKGGYDLSVIDVASGKTFGPFFEKRK